METTLQSSPQDLRTNLGAIEAIELAILSFVLWGLMAMTPTETELDIIALIVTLVIVEGAVLGSWLLYNGYIRVSRGGRGGAFRDFRVMVSLGVLTGGYTLITWTILDLNRLIISKLFYRGEAPVEYVWSMRSKLVRKQWEQEHKAK